MTIRSRLAFSSARAYRPDVPERPWATVLLWILSLSGYVVAAYVLLVLAQDALVFRDGVPLETGGAAGWDSYSTWLASQHLASGQAVYPLGPLPGIGAVYYPPLYVQLTAPLGLLPWPVFAALARLAEFAALRGLAGSWRATGILLLFPPVLMEINIANIVLLTTLGASLALRGHPAFLGLASLPKYAPALTAPIAWRLYPAKRRALVAGFAIVAVGVGVSLLADPGLWAAWADSVSRLRQYGDIGTQTGFDSGFFLRVPIALGLVVLAMLPRWPFPRATALLATLVGLPALRFASLAILAGVPLLLRHDLEAAGSPPWWRGTGRRGSARPNEGS